MFVLTWCSKMWVIGTSFYIIFQSILLLVFPPVVGVVAAIIPVSYASVFAAYYFTLVAQNFQRRLVGI